MTIDCTDIKVAFGNRLKSFRRAKQLSQEKLAELAGSDRTYISDVELGKRNISIINICKFASALEIEIKDFFNNL